MAHSGIGSENVQHEPGARTEEVLKYARAGVDKSRGPRSQARKLAEVSAVVTAAKQ